MTPQMMKILKKLYKYDNKLIDEKGEPLYSEYTLSEKERALLSDYGWKPNEIEYFANHDEILQKLYSLKRNPALTKKSCIDAFVVGIGGTYLRGLSVLPVWHRLNTLPSHPYNEKPEYKCCWICGGHNKPNYINNSYFQYCLYVGNAYSSSPMYAYLNLRHLLEVPAKTPSEGDVKTLSNLFELLRTAPDDETPGKFEKRLIGAKILKGDKYTKRGVLNSLSIVGVIPNRFIPLSEKTWTNFGDIAIFEKQLKNTHGRSDMEMPWAGWHGSLKLNEGRVAELFGEYLKS